MILYNLDMERLKTGCKIHKVVYEPEGLMITIRQTLFDENITIEFQLRVHHQLMIKRVFDFTGFLNDFVEEEIEEFLKENKETNKENNYV